MKKNATKKQDVCLSTDNDHIEVSIKVPIRFRLPHTVANLKFIMVFLRLLLRKDGSQLCTFQGIAHFLGYADRRDVNNFWREFEDQGFDILAFLSRKVDLVACVPLIEDFVARNILLPVTEMHRKFVEKHAIKMSLVTFQKYLSQTCSMKLLRLTQKLLLEKTCGSGAVSILRLLADQHNVPVICDGLLEQAKVKRTEPTIASGLNSGLKRINLCMLVHYLVGSGMNLQTIALLLNVSKSTVSNLWHEIKDLPSLILNSIAKWSGKISIDEKYIKINNVPHYVITIVDFVTKLPLYTDIYPNTTKESYEECLRTFKQIYKKNPTLIVSDGSQSLRAGRLAVFPSVPHQLCKFHKIRNLFARISKCHLPEAEERRFKIKVIKVFRRNTVSGRKKGMRELITILPKSAAEYVVSNIIKHWPNLSKSLTSNASERYNRKIKKVMSGRYGLKSVETAANLANSLWLKELIDKGQHILQDDSLIASLNISQICQEKLDWQHLDLLFSKNTKKAA